MGKLSMRVDNVRSREHCARRLRRRERGFSLLEAVIALGILGLGVLAVAAALVTSFRYSERSRDLTQATYLAEQQMEIFSVMSATDVLAMVGSGAYPNDSQNPIDPDPNDGDATAFNRSFTITQDSPVVGTIALTVAVQWTDPRGNSRTVQLQSVKANL
jgi:type II secretory pathway pseudopilin PulG